MGTTYTVRIAHARAHLNASEIRATIEDVLAQIDLAMSGYRRDSEVARFNAVASDDWFAVSGDVVQVVELALEVSRVSGGAFDITVAPLVQAWGFGAGGQPGPAPDEKLLAATRSQVGFEKLHARMHPPALRKADARLTIDLNAIAPGYAVDRIAERLQRLGIGDFMVEIGGEVRVRGRSHRGGRWRVAVECPVDHEQLPYMIMELDDAAVATSGEYRNYYIRDGRRYSHTIDPRTARPIAYAPGSVVVIGRTAAHADAWATALNVLGPREGYALAAKHGLAAMFVEQHGGRWKGRMTPAFERSAREAGERFLHATSLPSVCYPRSAGGSP